MKSGIIKYQSKIGLSDVEVAEISAFVDNYVDVDDATNMEDAEMSGVYASIKEYSLELLKEIYSCRKILRGLSAGEAEEVRIYIRERFALDKKVPTRREEYVAMAENILEGHTALPAEQSDFAVPDAPFDRLQTAMDKLRPAMDTISRERAESRAKTAELRRLRKKGERILRNIYLRATAHWGVEDKRLLSLGMMYKRGIWTKKKPKSPEDEG
ncbi:MAG: hypothetical protein ACP5G4_03295 [bacterium]